MAGALFIIGGGAGRARGNCSTVCCTATSQQTLYCSSQNCNGSTTFNVCTSGYGTQYYYNQESAGNCCGTSTCSADFDSGQQCGSSGELLAPKPAAGLWAVYVRDCFGRYERLQLGG